MVVPSENEVERTVAAAIACTWAHVPEPSTELARVFALERERILAHFERLLEPVGPGVPRQVVSAGALRDAIRDVRAGRLLEEPR